MAAKFILLISLIFLVYSSGHSQQNSGILGAIRPIYIIDDGLEDNSPVAQFSAENVGRSGLASGEEEEEGDESAEDDSQSAESGEGNNFEERIEKNRKVASKSRGPLYGDPAQFEEEEDNRQQARLIWPFSLSVSKGVEKHGHGHGHGFGPPKHLSSHSTFKDKDFDIEFDDDQQDHHHKRKPQYHHNPFPAHGFNPEEDPEVEKIRLDIFRQLARGKKWKKILKYELAEAGAQIVTKAISFLEFI